MPVLLGYGGNPLPTSPCAMRKGRSRSSLAVVRALIRKVKDRFRGRIPFKSKRPLSRPLRKHLTVGCAYWVATRRAWKNFWLQ